MLPTVSVPRNEVKGRNTWHLDDGALLVSDDANGTIFRVTRTGSR
jgi:glucose/arabinose dehydrogenase